MSEIQQANTKDGYFLAIGINEQDQMCGMKILAKRGGLDEWLSEFKDLLQNHKAKRIVTVRLQHIIPPMDQPPEAETVPFWSEACSVECMPSTTTPDPNKK